MFKEILQDLVDRTDGGVAGLLMASDGIAIDQYSKGDGPFDIESVGMEYSVVLKGVQRAAEMLDAGATKEVSIKTERLTTVVRMLSDEYFVALAVAPGGNVGKARFLLRSQRTKAHRKPLTSWRPRRNAFWCSTGPTSILLGTREPDVYGATTLEDIELALADLAKDLGATIECRQSNQEGQLIDWLHEARDSFDGVVDQPRWPDPHLGFVA